MKSFILFLMFISLFLFSCSGKSGNENGTDETNDETVVDIPDEEIEDEAGEEICDIDQTGDEDAEEFQFDIQRVYDDVAWLAHDDRTGRLPGTKGNDDAVEYVRQLFEELDLLPIGDDNTFLQLFEFDMWEIKGSPEVSLGGNSLDYGQGFQVFRYSGSGEIEAEIVFAGHGMTVPPFDPEEYPGCILPSTGYDDFADIDVEGKIALVVRRGPKGLVSIHNNCPANDVCVETPCLWNFGYKVKNAALNGAKGVIVVNSYHESGAFPSGMTVGREYFSENIPSVFILTEEVEKIIPDLKGWTEKIDDLLVPQSTLTGVNGTINLDAGINEISSHNVIGVLPGKDPELAEEVIVIGAHLDHLGTDPETGEIYNGADDNASGTAVMMELARAFVLGGHENARTVVFAGWNAEELGLIGSCHYVENPLLPISKTVAAYSIDMVGQGGGYGLMMYGGNLPDNEWLASVMIGYGEELDLNYEVLPANPLDASDHVCFYYEGVPAVLLSTIGVHAHYHTPLDTIDIINKGDLSAAVWLSWAGIYPIAMGIEDKYIGSEIIYPQSLINLTQPVDARKKNVRGIIY